MFQIVLQAQSPHLFHSVWIPNRQRRCQAQDVHDQDHTDNF
jgi:hypothetical protein